MSVYVFLVTHGDIGSAMLATAKQIYGTLSLPCSVISTDPRTDSEQLSQSIEEKLEILKKQDSALILTDIIGATPCNTAQKFVKQGRIHLLTGLNLAMLIRTLNYPHDDLQSLSKKAYNAGIENIKLTSYD